MKSGVKGARVWTVAGMLGLVLLLGVHAGPPTAETPVQRVSAANAMADLEIGNKRYLQGHLQPKDFAEERRALANEQRPYAIVLSCSDSRVPPEILFDESLGKLFVVRVAGNVVNPEVFGSIEYAAEHLHVTLLLIMGHDRCGAVQAALDGGDVPGNVAALVKDIGPAAKLAKSQGLDAARTTDAAVRENVRLQMKRAVDRSTLLRELVAKRQLRIVGGVYHLDTGEMEWLQ